MASEMVGRGISCVSLRQRYGRNGGTKGQAEGAAQQAGLFLAHDANRKRFRRCRWTLPLTHDSDHCALVIKLETDEEGVKWYIVRRR